MSRVLVLNSIYEPHSFIDMKRGIKLIINEKVDVISTYSEGINLISGEVFPYPSILRLKNHVKRICLKTNFSRIGIIRRDKATCQYCDKKLDHKDITIDHVLPKHQGGTSTFLNCVVACQKCNNRKANKTPEEAKMPLLRKPLIPKVSLSIKECYVSSKDENWNADWDIYII